MNILRLVAVSGVLVGAGALLDGMHSLQRKQRREEHLDDALDGTFPASDPTATRDFAIPVNRM
jgi:hypothetical protein